MPDQEIPPDVCQRMGIPAGSRWGPNAGEIRRAQMQSHQAESQVQTMGMTP